MPYNTTAIPPRKEVTGQAQLPVSRVKKIVSQDQDVGICSNNAAFVMTVATELFIQYLASQAQDMAKAERKPRRNIQYKDLANAVTHRDNLEFLQDVIPKAHPFRAIKSKAAATRATFRDGSHAPAVAGHNSHNEDDNNLTHNGGGVPKKHRASGSTAASRVNGNAGETNGSPAQLQEAAGPSMSCFLSAGTDDGEVGPNKQLETEMREAQQANGVDDEDVHMTG